jgi:hypothetical protein
MELLISILAIIIFTCGYGFGAERHQCTHEWELNSKEKWQIFNGYTDALKGYTYLREYKCKKCNLEKNETSRVYLE